MDADETRYANMAAELLTGAGYGSASHVPIGIAQTLLARAMQNMATHPRVQARAEAKAAEEARLTETPKVRPDREVVGMMMLGLIQSGAFGLGVGYNEEEQRRRARTVAESGIILAEALMAATPWVDGK